jgi:hypothetical protein
MNRIKVGWGIDWVHLAQERDQWRVLVKTVVNFGFRKIPGIYLAAAQLLASQEGL